MGVSLRAGGREILRTVRDAYEEIRGDLSGGGGTDERRRRIRHLSGVLWGGVRRQVRTASA